MLVYILNFPIRKQFRKENNNWLANEFDSLISNIRKKITVERKINVIAFRDEELEVLFYFILFLLRFGF